MSDDIKDKGNKLLDYIDEKFYDFDNMCFKTKKYVNSNMDYEYIVGLEKEVNTIVDLAIKYQNEKDIKLLEFLAKNMECKCYDMEKEFDKYVGDRGVER